MIANFKRIKSEGRIVDTMMLPIEWPLTLIRDGTIPIADDESWSRNRAAIIPMFVVISFLYLNGNIGPPDDETQSFWSQTQVIVGFACIPAGLILGVIIRFKTKISQAPRGLLTLYSTMCFIMSIMWIQFTSNEIMDLLKLFGFVTGLPESLLALTIISWGNCLGDMTADVAMAKRGYGEMAITGTIAGPIFNILAGLGMG